MLHGACCTSAPLSPLCRILEGYRANVVYGKRKTHRRVQRKYAMDSKSVRCWPANKVGPSVGLYKVFIAPGIRYRITYMVPWFNLGYRTVGTPTHKSRSSNARVQ